jgi:hypothetical protein
MYTRFALELPAHLRRRITLDEARSIVADRLAHREENFLRLIDRAVWARPASPYRWLLERASVEPQDLGGLVRGRGLDEALRVLREGGVYVTFEEFRASVPIVRDGRIFHQQPADFGNPLLAGTYEAESGGSTSTPRRVTTDLANLFGQSPALMLFDHAHGLLGLPTGLWLEPLPASGLNGILSWAPYGALPERWFTSLGRDYRRALRFRLANRAAVMLARAVDVKIPHPEYVPLNDAIRIARWAVEARDRAGESLLRTSVGRAVRVALAASEAGLDLRGVAITAGSEAPTEAKVRNIVRSGARLATHYYSMEVGAMGMGCARPADANDQHLLSDHLAVITCPRSVPGFEHAVDAFHFTTLLPTARTIMINVETDDYGWIERRRCGCPLEDAGYSLHLRGIRSFRKLIGEGAALPGSEIEGIIEELLPRRFGGTPLDYQFAEEEDHQGMTRVVLRISPRIPVADERGVVVAVLDALRRGADASRFTAAIWESSGTLQIRREEPKWTSRGKLLPLDANRVDPGRTAQSR